jgi:hypothetical protein
MAAVNISIKMSKNWANSAVAGVLIGLILGYVVYVQPDYGITVKPIQTTVYAGFPAKTNIIVENIQNSLFHKYNYQIVLCTLVQETLIPPPESPPKLTIDFDGPRGANGAPFSTAIWINTTRDAKAGLYLINILGFGGDGKERSCSYILEVKQYPQQG